MEKVVDWLVNFMIFLVVSILVMGTSWVIVAKDMPIIALIISALITMIILEKKR